MSTAQRGPAPEGGSFGAYRLIWRLCTGGMAELFLALRTGIEGFEKIVALKRILPSITQEPGSVQMFLDEARLAARLDHPNIVRIYDLGEVDRQYFLAMEYLPGEDLREIHYHARETKARIPIAISASIIQEAAAGLEFAHTLTDQKGEPLSIVHRDISPNNIIVTFHGAVKLVDFGIAKARTSSVQTEAGQFKGKLPYASPEQIAGAVVDARTDIFALGVVFWELLTGKRLFTREHAAAVIEAVRHARIPPPSELNPEVPKALDDIVLKCLERNLDARYQRAADLQEDLDALLKTLGGVRSKRVLAQWLEALFGRERAAAKKAIALGQYRDDDIPQMIAPFGPGVARRSSAPITGHDSGTPSRPSPNSSAESSARPMATPSALGLPAPVLAGAASLEHDLTRGDVGGEHSQPTGVRPEPRSSVALGLSLAVLAGLFVAGAVVLVGFGLLILEPGIQRVDGQAPVDARASLRVETDPPGAALFIDGEPTGLRTPASLEGLLPGRRISARLDRAGYETLRREIELSPGSNDLGLLRLKRAEDAPSGSPP